MKILHTADLHLIEYGDERWKTLEKLLKIGKKNRIDVLVISGDLFDKDIKAESLRIQIREVFTDKGFKILIIPGNHDSIVLKEEGLDFGKDAFILTEKPFELNEVRFIGLPYEATEGERLTTKIKSLKKQLKNDRTNILLYHGELLDIFFSRNDFGEEGESRYMPVKLSYFKDLNINYVLAGHFHTRFDMRLIEPGKYFVYPGSPVSITRREIGQRYVNLFEVGKTPEAYALDTPHFEVKTIFLDPFSEENPLEKIKEEISRVHPEAHLILKITGYIDGHKIHKTEQQLSSDIKKLINGKKIESHPEFMDIQKILNNDIFKSFLKKLEESEKPDEEVEELKYIAIKAMMEASV